MKFQHFRDLANLLWCFLGCFIFLKEQFFNDLFNLSRYAQLLISSDLVSDIDRCGDENNSNMKYESCFPFVASLRQRTSRLGFVFSFHIDGYASFLRRRRLEPLVTSIYVTPFETLIAKMRWKNNETTHWVEMSSMRV